MSVVALDIGSSRIKALMASWDGRLVDVRSVPTPVQAVEKGEWAYPADAVLSEVEALVAALARNHPRHPVDTVVCSCLGTAMVPVDRAGNPLAAALAPADARPLSGPSPGQSVDLDATELQRRTGSDPGVASFLWHYLWWTHTQPEVMARLHRFRSLRGFVMQELCGADAEDPSWASRTMLVDLDTNDWSQPILSAAGLSAEPLPAIHPSTAAWPVSAPAAARFGLAPGAVAVLGAMDNCCSLFGASEPATSSLVNIVGTYEHLAGAAELDEVRAVAATAGGVVHSYLLPGQYISLTRVPMGDLLTQVSAGSPAGLEQLLDGVAAMPQGLQMGLRHDDVRAALDGGTPRPAIVQALLESSARVLRRFVDAWEEMVRPAGRIVAVGGGVARASLLQLKANLLGRPLSTLAQDEAAGLGALRVAAMAVRGLSPAAACELFSNPISDTFEPAGAR